MNPSTEFNDEIDDEVASMVKQPLLEKDCEEEEEEGPTKEQELSAVFSEDKRRPRRALGFGLLTGFFVHTTALAAYAAMVVRSGNEAEEQTSGLWMAFLSFLTQTDLMVYVLVWIAFTCTLTGSGMKMIHDRLGERVERRYVFLLGVYFLVGIVLGAFTAWSLIDSYLGFTVPLAPIAATVIVDLVLCYLMIWCYDVGNTNSKVDSNTDGIADTV